MKKSLFILFLFTAIAVKGQNIVTDAQFEFGLSDKVFFNQGAYENQKMNYLSLSFAPEFSVEWQQGDQGVYTSVFLRWFQHDDQRTHWDIRELYYQRVFGRSELSVGT